MTAKCRSAHLLLAVAVLAVSATAQAEPPTVLPPDIRQEVVEMPLDWRRNLDNPHQQKNLVERAIEIGPIAINKLLPEVNRAGSSALATYGMALKTALAAAQEKEVAAILAADKKLAAQRENLLRLGRLAAQLNAQLNKALAAEPDAKAASVVDFDAYLSKMEAAAEREAKYGALAGQLDEDQIIAIRETNQARQEHGLPPLEIDLLLVQTARDHSRDMEKHDFFAHESPLPGKKTFTDRAKRFGANASAENIAATNGGGSRAVEMWLKSEGHRANIMSEKAKRIGVGRSGKYYTQLFGR